MRYLVFILISLLICLSLSACLPARTPLPPLPTDTPLLPTETSTPTTVWFPPTATNTPLPLSTSAITPTLDLSPRYGALLFTDNFDGATAWTLGRMDAGNIAMGINEITLAVKQPRSYLSSLRHDANLNDFYLEITASPSLCRDADEYGLLLRVSPSLEFLRFGLLCNGQARLDRYSNGQATSPIPPVASGIVPPGAPNTSRLGVWAIGKELRFYANNQFLFSVRETSLMNGGLGVFARSVSSNALTVNFSNLSVYAASP